MNYKLLFRRNWSFISVIEWSFEESWALFKFAVLLSFFELIQSVLEAIFSIKEVCINNCLLLHEFHEPISVKGWYYGRYQISISSQQVLFEEVFTPFWKVVLLEVINDGKMVDIFATLRIILMPLSAIDTLSRGKLWHLSILGLVKWGSGKYRCCV